MKKDEPANQETAAKKKRAPKSGRRITITLSEEHYSAIRQAAAADDREPNNYLSRVVRQHFETLIKKEG